MSFRLDTFWKDSDKCTSMQGCMLRRGHEGHCVSRGSVPMVQHGEPMPKQTRLPESANTSSTSKYDRYQVPQAQNGVRQGLVTKSCVHDGTVPSLTLSSGKALYGARGGSLLKVDHLDLIIDLAGLVKLPPSGFVAKAPRRFSRLKNTGPEYIRLDWPDMTAPVSVGLRFWSTLLDLLPQHTAIACVGSHGRTGTAMAALLIADGVSAQQAIGMVREKHCKHAIETAGQERYLRELAQARESRE